MPGPENPAKRERLEPHSFRYWLSCPEMTGPLVHYIVDDDRATQISYKTFAKYADLEPLRAGKHPAMYRISSPENWAISFWRSCLPSGAPIFYFDWSRIEHVFVDRPIDFEAEAAAAELAEENPGASRGLGPRSLRVFHGTSSDKADEILRGGLVSPSMGYGNARWYTVATDFDSAAFHAKGGRGGPVVVEFEIPLVKVKRKWRGFPYLWPGAQRAKGSQWFALRQPLPAAFVRAVRPLPDANPHWEPDLRYLLSPPGATKQIGAETGRERPNGIARFRSQQDSFRYVLYDAWVPVAALQIVKRERKGKWHGTVANVYVVPERRRQGLATSLLRHAERDFDTIKHSSDLSVSGAGWKASAQSNPWEHTGGDCMVGKYAQPIPPLPNPDVDAWLYHVTLYSSLDGISEYGLIPWHAGRIGGAVYDAHRNGYIFLTEEDGIPFWATRAESWAEDSTEDLYEDGAVPVLLRVLASRAGQCEEDELGTRDAGNEAYRCTGVPPEAIQVWVGNEEAGRWVPIHEWSEVPIDSAFDIEEGDDGDPSYSLRYGFPGPLIPAAGTIDEARKFDPTSAQLLSWAP